MRAHLKRSAAAVPPAELRERLQRARAAMKAIQRVSDDSENPLKIDICRQIRALERDLGAGA